MSEKEIGLVSHYFNNISVGIIELTDSLRVGETIHIRGAHDDFTQTIKSMQIDHVNVTEAKRGDSVGIKVAQRVHENDRVFKVMT